MNHGKSEHGALMGALIRRRAGHEPEQPEEQDGEQATDFDGGARQTTTGPADMNGLIRRAAGY